ncbi:MAG: ribose 5-phosphate isomerase B [Spirochaetales bacterium]|nr:ribose 5-phosphate isomerase B [Spirochaetales bacterium]
MSAAEESGGSPDSVASPGKTVVIGADHGGFALKESLREYLRNIGYQVMDAGTYSADAVDYPDYALAVARKVASGAAARGIMLDGAGIGSCMVANKVKGVRAALCYNEKTILNSRLHNNANLLTLGAPFHRPEEAQSLVKLFLETEFEGGRHQKRVDKINALDDCQCQKSSCSCTT